MGENQPFEEQALLHGREGLEDNDLNSNQAIEQLLLCAIVLVNLDLIVDFGLQKHRTAPQMVKIFDGFLSVVHL